ncbi:MAG: glycosyltransferase family 2 protein [Chloroflexi bacterium]|nr:glycosyltransferase family 2 protein [Chloroflexota bacterium]
MNTRAFIATHMTAPDSPESRAAASSEIGTTTLCTVTAPDVSVVIPALNEASGIEATVRSIPLAEFRNLGLDVEILVIDNGSVDATPELAGAAGARVVYEPVRGYGSAYKRGFAEARGAIICTLDADQTYPADVLPGLVSKLAAEDLDFISTDRFAYMHNGVMSRRNKIGNAMLSRAVRVMYRVPFRDSQSGMWVFRKSLLDRIHLRSNGMALSEELKIEVAWRLRARCAEVPIKYGYRKGDSKLRVWRDGFRNLLHIVGHRFRSRSHDAVEPNAPSQSGGVSSAPSKTAAVPGLKGSPSGSD